ncbi:hypothetical protein TWF696_001256 [Orbilia brochopaga]|uniref:Uncharacterized protein n=1 Tax=Orbilia brochopaga TaxID=3140254 RepID=A0AAV9UC52_9PEZI
MFALQATPDRCLARLLSKTGKGRMTDAARDEIVPSKCRQTCVGRSFGAAAARTGYRCPSVTRMLVEAGWHSPAWCFGCTALGGEQLAAGCLAVRLPAEAVEEEEFKRNVWRETLYRYVVSCSMQVPPPFNSLPISRTSFRSQRNPHDFAQKEMRVTEMGETMLCSYFL